MMKDSLQRKGEFIRECAIFGWTLLSALAMCAVLAYGIWRLFQGLEFTDRQSMAVFCAIILTDWFLRWRKERRKKNEQT